VPRLPKTRQILAAVPFGEEDMLVDAAVPADTRVTGEKCWVSLRGWHILEQPEPRILVFDDEAGWDDTLALARVITEQMDATATLLTVAEDGSQVESRRAHLLARQQEAGLPYAEQRVRVGDAAEQIILQQNEALYSMVMLGQRSFAVPRPAGRRPPGRRLDAATIRVLDRSPNPVMVVKRSRPRVNRVLICTAVGEPGKNDVRVGGRLARRLGAEVTLLYVAPDGEEPGRLAQAHLERGSATLRAFDVPVNVIVHKAAPPSRGILRVVEDGNYDLIVIGNHGPQSSSIFARDDVMLQVLTGAERPVLVVPSEDV
jgi:nucleotide-binding universal stress UspA family protein